MRHTINKILKHIIKKITLHVWKLLMFIKCLSNKKNFLFKLAIAHLLSFWKSDTQYREMHTNTYSLLFSDLTLTSLVPFFSSIQVLVVSIKLCNYKCIISYPSFYIARHRPVIAITWLIYRLFWVIEEKVINSFVMIIPSQI